ncbi:MAG: hypothetical protein IJY57_04145 [Clostridia bacterium]|nr:hypothetical protein [Clostridia bacterium]
MDLLTILLIVDAGLLALVLIFSLIRFLVVGVKKNKAIAEEKAQAEKTATEEVVEEPKTEEPAEEEKVEETVAQPEEEENDEPAKEESPYVDETMITIPRIKVRLIESAPAQKLVEKEEQEEKKVEPEAYNAQVVNETTEAFEVPAEPQEELVVGEANALVIDAKRIPFKEKLLGADEKIQGYYNELYNKFISYRKMHPRVSAKGVSFRFGRDLVAKITYRGKTMKLHLALDINAFDEKVYFQKDMSDVKSYVEVPFTVKVKSDRGVKKAIELIDALTFAKGIEAKTRFETVDAVAELKALD